VYESGVLTRHAKDPNFTLLNSDQFSDKLCANLSLHLVTAVRC